jgi:hypothetical protein
VLLAGFGLASTGCGPSKPFDGPTVDAFVGRVTQDGKPVSFPESEQVILTVYHEKGQSFGIPLKPDGTFKIGWMPIGKYAVTLERESKGPRGAPSKQNVPGGLTIVEGQTEYTIDLGKARKP